jgi:hypothetical protein
MTMLKVYILVDGFILGQKYNEHNAFDLSKFH